MTPPPLFSDEAAPAAPSHEDEDLRDDLDPEDWTALRMEGHRMLDQMIDHLRHVRQRPVWQPAPESVRVRLRRPLPQRGTPLAEVHDEFMRDILPYAVGNTHPRFFGWVHGGGTVVGMLAEMLAAGLNANVGGRNQVPVLVEHELTRWMAALFGFPESASGVFVTGTSMANLAAVLIARTRALGASVRRDGVAGGSTRLVAYAGESAHESVPRALDISGMGTQSLRRVALDPLGRMDLNALRAAIACDRAAGLRPFLVVATAGTVDTGAIDPLEGVSEIARDAGAWFHVDGAFGALAMLSPRLAPLLAGISRADSIAFDFHKWGQVPYDAGYLLVRDEAQHREAFAMSPPYLRRGSRGLAAGERWPCDYGPDLSRGFRALKTWITLRAYGRERLGRAIEKTTDLASYLARRVQAHPLLELLAPVTLNIVCFRFRCDAPGLDKLNAEIAIELQESGVAAPSTTIIEGRLALRAAIVNHRTTSSDIGALLDAVISTGRRLGGLQ